MAEENLAPIIVIKKKKGHAGRHGGAWKVAYADFVTAMMAFFLVMWLMNSSAKVQNAVGSYFRDPAGSLFHYQNRILRVVNPVGVADLEAFLLFAPPVRVEKGGGFSNFGKGRT